MLGAGRGAGRQIPFTPTGGGRMGEGDAANRSGPLPVQRVRRGFYEFDEKIHDVSGRLRGMAAMIERGEAAYDRALAAAGLVAAAGIGLTLLTAGVSDVAGAAAEAGIAATEAA